MTARALVILTALFVGCGDKKPADEQPKPVAVDIEIAADGALSIATVPAANTDELETALRAVYREMGYQPCAIEAEPSVPYSTTLRIADSCKSSGAYEVSINSVPIDIPKAVAGGAVDDQVMLTVSIAKDGAIFVAGAATPDADLDARLRDLMRNPKAKVVVIPDLALPTGRVVDVWKRALAAGVPSIQILPFTESPPQPKP